MNKNRSIIVASAIALAVTAGSGVFMIGNASAAETVKKAGAFLGGKGLGRSVAANSDMATLLGLTTDALKTALQSGKSLAMIAGEQGVDVQKVIALRTTQLTTDLDKKLADGKITQTEYDSLKADLTTKATNEVNAVYTGRGDKGFGGRGGFGHISIKDNAELTALLGTTSDALESALTSGKSLAAIAAEKNVTVKAVTDLLTSQAVKALDEKFAAGTITQSQYNEYKAALSAKINGIVNNTFTGKNGFGGKGHGRSGERGTKGTATTPAAAASGTTAL